MELALNNGFSELSFNEMEMLDGGSFLTKAIAVTVGVIAVVAGPPAIITGAAAITCWYVGSALIAIGGVILG